MEAKDLMIKDWVLSDGEPTMLNQFRLHQNFFLTSSLSLAIL